MKSSFIANIILISFTLLCVLKTHELTLMNRFFRGERVIKLQSFQKAKARVQPKDLELLELWESMLTGRSAPLARWMKDQYKSLGLNHLFTPSGFHLSAVLLPFMKLISHQKWQIGLLTLLALFIYSLPGQGALKRMVLIKLNQKMLGQKTGFILALLADILFGTFTNSPLSFCYSFLFLGIIYAGVKNLFVYFFFAQCLIAYFNGEMISPLILLLSPLLNVAFGLAMPFLFVLAFPLWNWQLDLGIRILRLLQFLVGHSAQVLTHFPCMEMTFASLLLFTFVYFGKRKLIPLVLILMSSSLNLDMTKQPSLGLNDYAPQGSIKRTVSNEKGDLVYWTDGNCKRELVRGMWWEKCSPKRGSTRKKIMKLSSL